MVGPMSGLTKTLGPSCPALRMPRPVREQVRRVVAEGRCDERVVAHPCVYEAKVEHQAKSSIPVSIMSNVGA